MGYLSYKSQYFKTFRKRPPHWLLVGQSLYDQINTMKAAIEAGQPLPAEKKPMIFIFSPENLPK